LRVASPFGQKSQPWHYPNTYVFASLAQPGCRIFLAEKKNCIK